MSLLNKWSLVSLKAAQQASAATEQGMGAVNTNFDNAQNQLQEQAARTNNPASLTAGEDALALNRGTALGNESNQLQEQQFNNQMRGASGLNNLFNTNQQTSNQMYGLGPGALNANAQGQSGLQDFTSILGAAGQLGGGVGGLLTGIGKV